MNERLAQALTPVLEVVTELSYRSYERNAAMALRMLEIGCYTYAESLAKVSQEVKPLLQEAKTKGYQQALDELQCQLNEAGADARRVRELKKQERYYAMRLGCKQVA